MSIPIYIDWKDLEILSYNDRILCINEKKEYIITDINKCSSYKKHIEEIVESMIKCSDNTKKKCENKLILAKLDIKDVKLLEMNRNKNKHNEEIMNERPIFFSKRTNKSIKGGDGKVKYNRNEIISGNIEKGLKLFLKSSKIVGSIGAIIATGGAGGDIIVKLISTTIDSGLFSEKLIEIMRESSKHSKYLESIYGITIEKGPMEVRKETISIIQKMIENGDVNEMNIVCPILLNLLESIGNIIGDWISAFIPDDGGLIGLIVENILTHTKKNSFDMLLRLYNILPNSIQSLLQNPNEMKIFSHKILDELRKSLTTKNESFGIWGIKFGLLKSGSLTSGMKLWEELGYNKLIFQKIFDVIEIYYEPNINKAITVLQKVLPLGFVVLTLNEFCPKKINNNFEYNEKYSVNQNLQIENYFKYLEKKFR